ncbi:hypothetical protein D9M69_499010 [compost metagenome]
MRTCSRVAASRAAKCVSTTLGLGRQSVVSFDGLDRIHQSIYEPAHVAGGKWCRSRWKAKIFAPLHGQKGRFTSAAFMP